MNRTRNTVAMAVVATMLAVLFTTCESGMLQEIREVSQAAQAASETQYYTITYDGNGADTGEVPVDDAAYEQGHTVTVLGNVGGLAKDGHNFAGWNTAADGHGTNYGTGAGLPMGTAHVTLYARWTQLNVYEVLFNSQGGSGVPMQEVIDGELAGEPVAPTREGYTFGGWFREPECVNTWDFSTDVVTTDRVLWARWAGNTYFVAFSANGGSGSMANQQVIFNESVALSSNTFSRAGHSFAGWMLTFDGPVVYQDGSSYTHTTSGNRYLYAKWTIHTYSVSYDANSATGGSVPADQTKVYGEPLTLAMNSGDLVKTGYRFTGWNTNHLGTGTSYEEGEEYTDDTSLVLYAEWREYRIGDTGPAGGVVFYAKSLYSNGWRYMEAAPAPTEFSWKLWADDLALVGGTSLGIGSGAANTQWLVSQLGDGEYAARVCSDLSYNDYADWFLPSRDELALMYENLHHGGIGDFNGESSYWSSSEFDGTQAWMVDFGQWGNQGPLDKGAWRYVRAARTF